MYYCSRLQFKEKKQNMKKNRIWYRILLKCTTNQMGVEVWIPAAAVVLSVAFFLSYFRFLFSYSFHISVSCFSYIYYSFTHTHILIFMIITAQHVSQKLVLISFLSFLSFFRSYIRYYYAHLCITLALENFGGNILLCR